jgi:hypothetical protein
VLLLHHDVLSSYILDNQSMEARVFKEVNRASDVLQRDVAQLKPDGRVSDFWSMAGAGCPVCLSSAKNFSVSSARSTQAQQQNFVCGFVAGARRLVNLNVRFVTLCCCFWPAGQVLGQGDKTNTFKDIQGKSKVHAHSSTCLSWSG